MRVKGLRLALIVVAPVVCLVVGVLLLRDGATPSLADGPNLSAASAWPPIPTNLSRTGDRYSKVAAVEANASGILVVWSEGATSPNGQAWMSWNSGSGWRTNRVDDKGGYIAFSPAVALQGTTAHFVWVGKIVASGQYCVFYRARNLATGTWLSDGERVYPASGDTSDELGNAQIALDASGAPHVIWTRKYVVNVSDPKLRDRIFYSNKEGGFWSGDVRISGYDPDYLGGDSKFLSQDMPAIVANGEDIYVAWREKSTEYRKGIWVRHRTSAGLWLPETAEDGVTMGYQISGEKLDEFPAMAASGDRLYVMWDRYLRSECTGMDLNCYHVYSMTYRLHDTGADITASWAPTVTEEPLEMVLGDNSPITALSWVTTADGKLDPVFEVPIPDDYYSGVRPQIRVTSVYTPYVVWHHWANEGHWSDKVNGVAPYQVFFSYVYEGDWETARWEDPEPIFVMGSRGIFASPAMVLAPGIESPHDLHVALNVRLRTDPAPWDVLYTNLGQYHWVYLPSVTRNY